MKALLVDDSKAARFAMGKLLKDQGLEVEMAASGEEALDKIATEPIQIVFMDQSMPGMGGIAATRAITSNEKTAHIPVVMCTGNEGDQLEQIAKEAGAIGVLTKPPKEEALKEILAQLEEAPPAVAAAAAIEEPQKVDMEAVLSEVESLLEKMRAQLHEDLGSVEQSLKSEIGEALRSTEQKLQPLQTVVGAMDGRITEKVKEAMAVDASNQRIQLEALRQQVNSGLDEMEEREARLRENLLQEIRKHLIGPVDSKLSTLKKAVEKSRMEAASNIEAMEARIDALEKRTGGLLAKAAGIAILAAGAAFGAAFFLLGGG